MLGPEITRSEISDRKEWELDEQNPDINQQLANPLEHAVGRRRRHSLAQHSLERQEGWPPLDDLVKGICDQDAVQYQREQDYDTPPSGPTHLRESRTLTAAGQAASRFPFGSLASVGSFEFDRL